MTTNCTYDADGNLLMMEDWNLDTRTLTRTVSGKIVEDRPMTEDEIRLYGPQPLNPPGVLATLLVVNGILDINDAANAVHVTPQALIDEAKGWAAAEETP